MSQQVDVVVAFVLLMFVASLFITAATQVVVSLLGLRGTNLRRGLADLLDTAYPDQETRHWSKEIAGRVLRHPTISDSVFSHFWLREERVPFLPPETLGKLQGISASIPLWPWILGGVGGFFFAPILMTIAKGLFGAVVCQYSDILAGYISAIDFCAHPWRTGALVGAILGGLLNRWRLATSIRVEELPAVLERLSEPHAGTLPDAVQRLTLKIAWGEKEPGAKTRVGAGQAGEAVRPQGYFDEGIVGRASKASLQNQSLYPAAADFDEGIVRHAEPLETESSVAVAEEHAATHANELEAESTVAGGGVHGVPASSEPQLEGLQDWFDRVMERASQRFTAQARVITVVLSCIFALGWHFDAIRLLQSMSQGAELRAQLAATAAGIDKQVEQLRSKQGGHVVVPEVYRQAMMSVLRGAAETSTNNEGNESKGSARRRGRVKEREKVVASPAPAEDPFTAAAKSKAERDLEPVPGFASREDAESWLRATLEGNPASEKLAAAYRQEVNAELVSDSDKLIDESASLKSELARAQFKLFQDEKGSQSSSGAPGLLVTVALLSLGAAFWYNTLKNLASLRPRFATKAERN